MNVPHNNTSAAYDMSLFDTAGRKEQEAPQPELKVARASVAKVGKPVLIVAVSAIFLAVFIMFIYSKATLSETNVRLSQETQALKEVENTNALLQAELSGSVSLESVEKYAVEHMGMQKINSSQEQYVEMKTGTMTETAEAEEDNIFVSAQKWFNGVLEYLGF